MISLVRKMDKDICFSPCRDYKHDQEIMVKGIAIPLDRDFLFRVSLPLLTI